MHKHSQKVYFTSQAVEVFGPNVNRPLPTKSPLVSWVGDMVGLTVNLAKAVSGEASVKN